MDAGDPTATADEDDVTEFDQRGSPFLRVANGDDVPEVRIDMGSYESQGVPSFNNADYNENGIVDLLDYVNWRNTLGQTEVPPFSGADGDGNGDITAIDYHIWKSRFGQGLMFEDVGMGAGKSALLYEQPQQTATIDQALERFLRLTSATRFATRKDPVVGSGEASSAAPMASLLLIRRQLTESAEGGVVPSARMWRPAADGTAADEVDNLFATIGDELVAFES